MTELLNTGAETGTEGWTGPSQVSNYVYSGSYAFYKVAGFGISPTFTPAGEVFVRIASRHEASSLSSGDHWLLDSGTGTQLARFGAYNGDVYLILNGVQTTFSGILSLDYNYHVFEAHLVISDTSGLFEVAVDGVYVGAWAGGADTKIGAYENTDQIKIGTSGEYPFNAWWDAVVVNDAAGGWVGPYVASPPDITLVSPDHGAVGDSITITGTDFGGIRGSSTVTFNGTAVVTYTSWSDTQVVVVVPVGATSGNIQLTTAGGSDTYAFDVTGNEELLQLTLSPATGDTPHFDGTRWQRLAIGATGDVLRVVAGLPAWATPDWNNTTAQQKRGNTAGLPAPLASGQIYIDTQVSRAYVGV